MSDIYSWSLMASENAGADSIINWSEGQFPHTVNNSARGMMQRVREYLSDTGGALEGIVEVDFERQYTVIRLTSRSQPYTYSNGLVVRFKSKGNNIGATTVSINDFPSKPVYKASATGVTAVVGGEIQTGCIYTLVYDEEISGWQLLNPTRRKVSHFQRLPIGFIGNFAMETLPDGWLLCDGSAYSRDTYHNLFATIGTMWGNGDGATTFNVPDFRGMFLRGFDYFGSVDAGRSFASIQQYSLRGHDYVVDAVAPARRSSRSKRDLSSDPETRRIQEYAVKGCFDHHGTLDDVYKCIARELRGAPAPMSLIERYSKRCFSPSLWGYADINCPLGPKIPPSVRYYVVNDTVDGAVNEECAGLTGDALERCNEAFERVTQKPQQENLPEASFPEDTQRVPPFLLQHENRYLIYTVPKEADLGIHDHIATTCSFGGIETRPINTSIVYGIKT
ncbi:hypothetical protein ABID39_001433 [Bartonella japonica]|uniref:Phage tail collar domain-containing protein n=1 Tax=Bartonella japonica TaxID=357761 RepID=A0ABV2FQ70_9HYPH